MTSVDALRDELIWMLELDALLADWAIPNPQRRGVKMPGPIPPAEYDGEHLDTDEKLKKAGWAAGLDVWEQVEKAYGNYLGDDTLANAQLWSLRQAIRAELLAELRQPGPPEVS